MSALDWATTALHPNEEEVDAPIPDRVAFTTTAVVGLGYVGLPTAIALAEAGGAVVGVDVSSERLHQIAAGRVDLPAGQRRLLRDALADKRIETYDHFGDLGRADVVVICVPTPVDDHLVPDTRSLRSACDAVVGRARAGQCIVLTSTTYIGSTRDLLVEPLRARGLVVGRDVHVAFMPERIDPGIPEHAQNSVPRVVGGATLECAHRAAELLGSTASTFHVVSSLEAAELAKLHENTFRAVNIAYVNELAEIASLHDLDITEVIDAAATKPYGFMAFRPGPGVGGHCIPCDPHYLLWGLRGRRAFSPVIDAAMTQIARRPQVVVDAVVGSLGERGIPVAGARALVVGVSYKPGVQDVRESPALEIIERLRTMGATVSFSDPLVRTIAVGDGGELLESIHDTDHESWDVVIVNSVAGGLDCSRFAAAVVIDTTYRMAPATNRVVP